MSFLTLQLEIESMASNLFILRSLARLPTSNVELSALGPINPRFTSSIVLQSWPVGTRTHLVLETLDYAPYAPNICHGEALDALNSRRAQFKPRT